MAVSEERIEELEAIIAYQSMEIDALRIALGLVVDGALGQEQRDATVASVKAIKPQLVATIKAQSEEGLSDQDLDEEADAMIERIAEPFQNPVPWASEG